MLVYLPTQWRNRVFILRAKVCGGGGQTFVWGGGGGARGQNRNDTPPPPQLHLLCTIIGQMGGAIVRPLGLLQTILPVILALTSKIIAFIS